MKFIHLSDLHLGKKLNEFSLLDDQQFILSQIIEIIDKEKPFGIIIAGDIYDKSVPTAESVQLLDDFLYSVWQRNIKAFIISGNHDSAERIAFGSRLMDKTGIFLSPVYNGSVLPFSFQDDYGNFNIYLLPFIKPSHVRAFFPDKNIENYTDAMNIVISQMNINQNERNIIVCHQFVAGATTSDSEEITIGSVANVSPSVFDPFDYVALGHLHSPQEITRSTIRYCGTPLKYSFSEINHIKSATVIEFFEKDNIKITTIPFVPKRDLIEIRGTYDEITEKKFYQQKNTEDFAHIILTDEEDVANALEKLRIIYPNLLKLDYDNKRTRATGFDGEITNIEAKSPLEIFEELYEKQNGQVMSEIQKDFMQQLIEEVWESVI